MINSTFSIVRAIVTQNQDPDQLGRIKVRFPFLGGKAKDNESVWCRVARPVSHGESGDWFLPNLDDEVLVAFENNDMNRPIIMGALFSEERKPPRSGREGDANADGNNSLRFTKSPGGHTFFMDDTEGKEAMGFFDKVNNQITLDSGKKSLVIKDTNSNTVELKSDGITIKAKNGDCVELNSSGITIQSAGSVKVVASSKIELGEGASKSLVFGEDLMQAFNSHTHIYAATTSMGTTQPPIAPLTPGILSKKVKTS